MARDTNYLEDLKRKKTNIRPGRRADEIRRDLTRKEEEVAKRRWEKVQRLREMESSLAGMKDDLSRSHS